MPRKPKRRKHDATAMEHVQWKMQDLMDVLEKGQDKIVRDHVKLFSFLREAKVLKKTDPVPDYFNRFAMPFMEGLMAKMQDAFTEAWLDL